MVSCSKQLDINTDPNNPLELSESRLLPRVQKSIGDGLAIGSGSNGGLSTILQVYTHQMTTREDADQYGATGGAYYIQQAWNRIYKDVLTNVDFIIKNGTENGNLRYVGIAKILKAYTFSQLVDVFGDVPFSEANQLVEGIFSAKFDKDSEIYPQLIAMIDEGITDLNNNEALNLQKPGTDDIMYKGNVGAWIKAANTIKLKLYTQQRLVKDVTSEVNALISGGNLISATAESFLVPYGPNSATDDRNPGFGDYFASQRSNHVSPWFYEIMKGYNIGIYEGIEDPRVPYYIYNQLKPNADDPGTEYKDGAFVSMYFGGTSTERDKASQSFISLFGMYPVGGRYDDGQGGTASASSGTGAAPYRLITYADRLYLEAELIKTGVVAGDAKAKFEAAIRESFKQVDYVITTFVKPTQRVPALVGSDEVETYIKDVLSEYDNKPAQQLESIMTQKWLSSVGSAVDQYTDYRRTGFPVLFNPKDPLMAPGGIVTPHNPESAPVKVQLDRGYPLSLPWYQTELETNQNAPAQKTDLSSAKVFWQP